MSPPPGKQRKAYCRKLWVAQLIASGPHDRRALEVATGMPRRTLQDCIADLADIGIACEFVQQGPKHRHGHYAIRDWGDRHMAPDGPPVHYRHAGCGGVAHVSLACDRCGEALTAREVTPEPGPGAVALA